MSLANTSATIHQGIAWTTPKCDIDRAQQNLIGYRIEVSARGRRFAQAPRQKTVDHIRNSGQEKQNEAAAVMRIQDRQHHEWG